jgi:hypothetical protein
MQTLGLSESTPRPTSRLKTLFWPRVQYIEDVDLLGTQGYWVCIVLGVFVVLTELSKSQGPAVVLDGLFYFLSGVGIRRNSRFAAITVFVIYLLSVIVTVKVTHRGGVITVFFLAVLLSNVRATWLAKRLAAQQESRRLDQRSDRSFMSVLSDTLPRLIWPIGRWIYGMLAVLMFIGIAYLLLESPGNPRRSDAAVSVLHGVPPAPARAALVLNKPVACALRPTAA